MVSKEEITKLTFEVVDELNEELPSDKQLTKMQDTILFGESGKLNSLNLVRFILAIEERVEEKYDALITIADKKALSRKNSPFKTIGTLVDYVQSLLEEKLK